MGHLRDTLGKRCHRVRCKTQIKPDTHKRFLMGRMRREKEEVNELLEAIRRLVLRSQMQGANNNKSRCRQLQKLIRGGIPSRKKQESYLIKYITHKGVSVDVSQLTSITVSLYGLDKVHYFKSNNLSHYLVFHGVVPSQSVVPEPAALAAPERLLEIQHLRPHPPLLVAQVTKS